MTPEGRSFSPIPLHGGPAAVLLSLGLLFSSSSCGRSQGPISAPAALSGPDKPRSDEHGPPLAREDGRLPPTAKPLHYALSLRIDPRQPRFSGTTRIDVDVLEPTSFLVLHARDMNVLRAEAHVGSATITAAPSLRLASRGVVPEELVLAFTRVLPQGRAALEISYEAPFARDLAGLYRVEEDGRMYAYTQFEVASARRAFPCFDEPDEKTPYDVTIAAPAETIALANSPEVSHATASDGTVEHRFAPTPPLPSYLVAFAVGDFDIVNWQKDPFPIRAVTTKGRANLTGLALEAAAALVAKLSDYFAIPYPFAKLDLVAVPDFAAGAMENPGLVTFRDSLLLLDGRRATTSNRRTQAQVIAHELAHQWLGDLVTVKWWDDLWLNEGFAMWAEAKIVDAWRPSFGATIEQIAGVQHVMDIDGLNSARAVREPVRSTSDAEEAFDGITYDKGAAVLRMIEGWLGPDVFRRGVQRYLRENAWKSARSDDLFRALEYVSTQRIGELARSFLDQPGVPDVVVNWTCGGSGRIELSESDWRPLGGGGASHRVWTLPVCIETDTQKTKTCFTLGRDPIVRDLGPNCPTWVYPNAGEAGYYRFLVEGARLMALARGARALSPIDRLGLVSNAWAEVRQGAIGGSVLLEMLPAFDAEMDRNVVEQIASTLEGIDHALVDDDVRDSFRRWAGARMATRKASLGWEPAPNEDDNRTIERRTVLWLSGELAYDDATLNEAAQYAESWLRDPTAVPADTAAVAVPLASIRAGASRLYELRSAVANAKTPEDRALAIRAMGMFDDAVVLGKALNLALTDEIKLSELRYLFGSASGHRASAPILYAWEKANWAKLRARLPGSFGGGTLLDVASTMCTAAARDDASAFFLPATRGMEGVKRRLDEALESAGLCVALHERGAAEVSRYLRRREP